MFSSCRCACTLCSTSGCLRFARKLWAGLVPCFSARLGLKDCMPGSCKIFSNVFSLLLVSFFFSSLFLLFSFFVCSFLCFRLVPSRFFLFLSFLFILPWRSCFLFSNFSLFLFSLSFFFFFSFQLKFTSVVDSDTTLHDVHSDTVGFSSSVLIRCSTCSYHQSDARSL